MKHKKLPSFLALSISLELVLSPLPALAQNQNVMNTINQSVNLGMGVYNTFRGNPGQQQMPPHVATDMTELRKQQTPGQDKYFNYDTMKKIPGFQEYIAKNGNIDPRSLNCSTLPTTMYEANTEVCRNKKVSTMAGDPRIQSEEAFAYYNQYFQLGKQYSNFQGTSNASGQAFGPACMASAKEVLNGFFAYRVEQLGVIATRLDVAIYGGIDPVTGQQTPGFIKTSEKDLLAIKEASAVLNGEDSAFASEFKDSQVFDYSKRFADPACTSLNSKENMNKLGKEGKDGKKGLMGILGKLDADYSQPAPGSQYSPSQYMEKNADIVNDIKKMADKVAEQSNLNFGSFARDKDAYSKFLGSVGSDVSSDSGANVALNKGFFSDLQTKFSKTANTLNNEANLLVSELGGASGSAVKELGNVDNDSNFAAEMTSMENRIKGTCVKNSGIDEALSRMYDPSLSKSGNKYSSQQIKKQLLSFINDVTLSPEKKLEKLNALEAQGGSSYEMKMDSDYKTNIVKADGTVGTKSVNAAQKITPGTYFTDIINNCESQFQVNKLNNKLSGKEAVKKLWALKKDFQKAANQHAKDIKSEITKKMIDCNGDGAVASSSTAGSCTPAKLDMGKPGFCTKAAFSCSSNMKKCSEKAQKFVTDIKADRSKRRENYNQNVESTGKQMLGMFDTGMAKYMKEAEVLRGMFSKGFTNPQPDRDLSGPEQYMSKAPYSPGDAGDKIDLKDPVAYLKMVKGNLAKLQEEVTKQQEAIMGEGGPLQKHIADTTKNYSTAEKVSKTLAADCLEAYNSYKTLLENQQKMATDKANADQKLQGELGQKEVAFCNSYNDVMVNHVVASCDDAIGSVSDSMIQAASLSAQQSGDYNTVSEANRMRSEMQIYCNQPGNQRNKEGSSTTTALGVCSSANLNKDPIAIKALSEVKGFTPGQVVDGKPALEKAEKDAKATYDQNFRDLGRAKTAKETAVTTLGTKKTELTAASEANKLAYQTRVDDAEKALDAAIKKVEDLEDEVAKTKIAWDEAKDVKPTETAATGGICDYLLSEACTATSAVTSPTTGQISTTVVEKCKKFEEQIVANYTTLKQSGGSIGADTTSGDAAAFCNAGNNSGPYNTKNWMNPGNSNNPMANGGSGTVGY